VLSALASLNVVKAEIPSASLNVAVKPGSFISSAGTIVNYAGTASFACTTGTTNYLWLTDAGVLTKNTTGFPTTAPIVHLAVVLAGATTITSITDARIAYVSGGAVSGYLPLGGGTLADPANIVLGTSTGTKIGTAVSQKLGFFNATPVVQPSGAAQAAITDSSGGTPSTTVADVGASFSQTGLNNIHASILNELNAIRSALVTLGIIKGSA